MTNGNDPNRTINSQEEEDKNNPYKWQTVIYNKKLKKQIRTISFWQEAEKQQSKQVIQADQTQEMTSITLFIENYQKIINAIGDLGFCEPILFKGFCPAEEHNLNIHMKNLYRYHAEAEPQTHRMLVLKDQLDALLKCKIILSVDEQMDPYYADKLKPNNSVKLTNGLHREAIENVFGKNWYFNPADNYPDYWKTPLVSTNST